MIITLKSSAKKKEKDFVVKKIKQLGYKPHVSSGQDVTIIGMIGERAERYREIFESIDSVDHISEIEKPYKLASREFKKENTVININGVNPGAGTFPSSSIKYVRVSNLDTTSSLAVSFTASDDSSWSMECLPTSSIMFSSSKTTGSNFNGTFTDDITNIAVYSLSSSLDVEYVVVNA